MKLSAKGFGAIEIILIVVVVGLVGLSGYLFWQLQKNSKATTTSTSQQSKDTKTNDQKDSTAEIDTSYELKPVAETADWKTESNTEFGFSYKYPADGKWDPFLIATNPSSEQYKDGERVNNAGVNYTACGRNCGLAFSFGVYVKGSKADPGKSFAEDLMKDNSYYKMSFKQPVELDGAKGMRSEYSPDDNKAGTTLYYYFTKGDRSYTFTLNMNGALADGVNLTERGDRIMETFKFPQ